MARMPQIPEPDLSSRPSGRVEQPTDLRTVDTDAVMAPFQDAAQVAGGTAQRLEELQQQRDDAQDKLQKVADGVTATKLAGDHAEKLRDLATQLQKQLWDTPDKYPDEFRRQAQALTDSEIANAPNQQVALELAQRNAAIDNQQTTLAHSWMLSRTAQKAKSDVTGLIQDQTKTAQSLNTLRGLSLSISTAEKQLTPLLQNTHVDPEASVTKLRHDMAAAWVDARMQEHPVDTGIALDQKDGPLQKYLAPKELLEYKKQVITAQKSYGEVQRFDLLKQLSDSGAKNYESLVSGDFDERNQFQLIKAATQKIDLIKSNTQLAPDDKKEQLDLAQRDVEQLKLINDIRNKPGRFDRSFDQEKQADLFKRFSDFTKAKDAGPSTLSDIVKFRYDLIAAEATGVISPARAQALNKGLTNLTGKALSAQKKNTGWGFDIFTNREPVQMGNLALENAMKSPMYKRLTPDEQNQARTEYIKKLNDAIENSRNVDSAGAQRMAAEALKYVAGR